MRFNIRVFITSTSRGFDIRIVLVVTNVSRPYQEVKSDFMLFGSFLTRVTSCCCEHLPTYRLAWSIWTVLHVAALKASKFFPYFLKLCIDNFSHRNHPNLNYDHLDIRADIVALPSPMRSLLTFLYTVHFNNHNRYVTIAVKGKLLFTPTKTLGIQAFCLLRMNTVTKRAIVLHQTKTTVLIW